MLELNKEYTYTEICEALDWTVYSGGASRKAQIKEIESSYEFYHPMNKKTHKEKKSYIFTKQLKEMIKPSLANSRGNNNKNIRPMIEYLQGYLSDDYVGEYYSLTAWYTEILNLLDKDLCRVIYQGDDEITAYCKDKGIQNKKLMCDYVSSARSILKNILLKALENMYKNDLCEFEDGYIFIYLMNKRGRTGRATTDIINEIVLQNETAICNDMKRKYNLSDKMHGRQLLFQINSNKEWKEDFDETKILDLMADNNAIDELNKWIEAEHSQSACMIDEKHPLINYYRGICVHGMELVDADTDVLAKEICTIVRNKTRKAMYSKGGKNSRGEKYYVYNEFEHSAEMDNIEKLLFVPCISPINALTDEEIAELDELFNCTVCEAQPHPTKVTDSDLDYPVVDSQQGSQKSSKVDRYVLSQEEAWELFA